MTAPDLKPCPFCGGNLVWSEYYREFHHPLAKCMLTGSAFADTDDKVIAAWNTRATPLAEALAVQDAARVLLDWWNSDEVSDARVIVAVSTALKANEGHTWEQFDAALRAIGEGKA